MRPLLLVAHGTRDPAGARVVENLAVAVRKRLPQVRVEIAYADVRDPDVTTALAALAPAVVVPAFLASGYHVRVDIPAQVADRAVITEPLGPAPGLIAAAHVRLTEAGWRGEPIVLAAAGSTAVQAQADTEQAAAGLAARTGVEVRIGYATRSPRITEVANPGWAVSSWLLAPGLFHRSARASAPVVSDPLGTHPNVVDLIVTRYRTAPPAPRPALGLPRTARVAVQGRQR
ncbi:sirohydrochlorin chelatase [Actinophytocola gossypii]|uniref:Sirohydrochlorin chelatase n=1 Tax=Actinophytocola gossypii TaxID=2812003 RepID=A0ABT2JHH8_9PSEU|nr:CbiX/SirB N-terminal domain-containing protein [Actinophytocola gossypii]MCT2587337.1 sirohydrochlorin chelatase [Actinophytocola gossypii]